MCGIPCRARASAPRSQVPDWTAFYTRPEQHRLITTVASGRARMPEEHKIVTSHHNIRKSEGNWEKSKRGPRGRLAGIRVREIGMWEGGEIKGRGGTVASSTEDEILREGWHTYWALVAGSRLACGGSVWVDEAGAVQRRQRGSSWRQWSVRRRDKEISFSRAVCGGGGASGGSPYSGGASGLMRQGAASVPGQRDFFSRAFFPRAREGG